MQLGYAEDVQIPNGLQKVAISLKCMSDLGRISGSMAHPTAQDLAVSRSELKEGLVTRLGA